ncbi:MAG: FAD-dependent oxidoreductase [Bacilli bacterium]|nr:FAD-dependent oxidoreductase [Bacilli bacterium]
MENNHIYETLIIGSGPCGIGCACKLKEAGIDFAVLESYIPGGKINIAPRVDNYPHEFQIPGPDLAMKFVNRLMDLKVPFINKEVISLTKENDLFKVELKDQTILLAKTVLLASGTKERKLGLAKEDEFLGHGISYCAICDGHFFRNKEIVVVGGGNSALKEAIYLSRLASKIYLVHRRNEFRGLNHLVDELKAMGNVEIITPYVPVEILGEEKVEGLTIEHRETGERRTLKVDGFFPLVGQIPNTQFVNIEGVKDESNLIPVNKTMETNCEGLFAGGDILPREIRQIYLAEHDGMVAAKNIILKLRG